MTSTPEFDPAEPGDDVATDAEAVGAEDVAAVVPDDRLFASHDLALAALREITAPATIGPAAGHRVENDGVVSLRFENRLAGYPGWFWTVSLAVVEDAEPTVLEVELLPGEGALLAPDWVPWATRLAEYHAQQAAMAEAAAEAGDDTDESDESDDSDDDDYDDSDDDDSDDDEDDDAPRTLHAGDLDGVDIDELDDSESDDDESDEDEDDSDEDDESGDESDDEDESDDNDSDEDDESDDDED